MNITVEQLKYISNGYGNEAVMEGIAKYLPEYLDGYKINTTNRLAMFLGNASEETDSFKTLHEYASGAEYEGREDLGNTEPGDGVRFKGRGIFMITGRYNYDKFGKLINEDLVDNPGKAAEPEIAVNLACEFWDDHNLSEAADTGNFKLVCEKINGGLNGYDERLAAYHRALKVVPDMLG